MSWPMIPFSSSRACGLTHLLTLAKAQQIQDFFFLFFHARAPDDADRSLH